MLKNWQDPILDYIVAELFVSSIYFAFSLENLDFGPKTSEIFVVCTVF